LEKEISDLKKIVYHLKKEIEQKDKELITRENQLAEFDVREKKNSKPEFEKYQNLQLILIKHIPKRQS